MSKEIQVTENLSLSVPRASVHHRYLVCLNEIHDSEEMYEQDGYLIARLEDKLIKAVLTTQFKVMKHRNKYYIEDQGLHNTKLLVALLVDESYPFEFVSVTNDFYNELYYKDLSK